MKIITNEYKNTNDYRVKTPVIIEKHKQHVNIEPITYVKCEKSNSFFVLVDFMALGLQNWDW